MLLIRRGSILGKHQVHRLGRSLFAQRNVWILSIVMTHIFLMCMKKWCLQFLWSLIKLLKRPWMNSQVRTVTQPTLHQLLLVLYAHSQILLWIVIDKQLFVLFAPHLDEFRQQRHHNEESLLESLVNSFFVIYS